MAKFTQKFKAPLFLFLVAGWAILIVVNSCEPSTNEDLPEFSQNTILGNENVEFLGAEACKSCHQTEYANWVKSHHFKSMMEANDTTVLGDFEDARFVNKGVTSRFYKENGEYKVETQGPEGELEAFKVKYTFGVEPLQQYLVEFPDGKLQTLHLSWDTELNQWFEQYPNDTFPSWDWLHWTKGAMTWNSMCADCHSTNLVKSFDSKTESFQTTFSIINVSCEACHGPGKAHVEFVNSEEYADSNKDSKSLLKQTSSISPVEQVEQCAPCHSRRLAITEDRDISERFDDNFIVDVLRAGLYHPDGQILEEDYVYGSFLQSKMYMNGVSCSDCHEVHSGELLKIGNALCTQCHSTTTYDSPDHHFHPVKTVSSECVSCHMTGKNYMVNDFRRDHSFRVPRPDQSILFDTPNACNGCHTDQSPEWAANAVKQWYGPERRPHFSDQLTAGLSDPQGLIRLVNDLSQPAIARATAIPSLISIPGEEAYQTIVGRLNDPNARVRIEALSVLASFSSQDRMRLIGPLLLDPSRSVRITASSLLLDVEKRSLPNIYQDPYDKARSEYLNSLYAAVDLPSGKMRIADYFFQVNALDSAIYYYEKAITADRLLPNSRINLAFACSRSGQVNKGIQALKEHIEYFPTDAAGYYYLGLAYYEIKEYDEAINTLFEAKNLDGQNPRTYYNLGLLLQELGRGDEAETIFLEGIEVSPGSGDLRYALVTTYATNGKRAEAIEQAEILQQLNPNDPNLNQLLNRLKQPQ